MGSKPKLITLGALGCIIVAFTFSCNKESGLTGADAVTTNLSLPATPYSYQVNMGFINGSRDDIATLGRVLFYDTHLSQSNTVSCGSCHKQYLAFSDNVAFSTGFDKSLTVRNALPIQNLDENVGPDTTFFIATSTGEVASLPTLFWDGRQNLLISMVLQPIANHIEMGMGDLNSVTERIKANPYYPQLFMNAYGSTEIDINKISNALAVFTGSITSGSSKFDQFINGTAQLSPLETQGEALFFNKYPCNSCHNVQLLRGYQQGGGTPDAVGFINIGLDVVSADAGRGAITNNPADNGKFKIPDLRNVMLTAPYMHDGRFTTIDQVLDHYSSGIQPASNLDPRLIDSTGNQPMKMNIPESDRTAIKAFLSTLTDYNMITDPRFSNPFKANN